MLKAVIFDLDGVIVDSEPMHFQVDQRVLAQCGLTADGNLLNPYVGVSNPEMWTDLKEKLNLELSVEDLLQLQSKLKIEVLNETKINAIDGVRELITGLKENKLALAVASSSPRFFIEAVLEAIEIKEFFDVIVSGEEVAKGKPYPDIFLKTAELLNVNPKECVVIEDSANGIRASVSAGMKCIGYANPNSGVQDLSNASAIVDSICKINCDYLIGIS